MTTNVGTIDRSLRAALGLVLLYTAFFSGLPLFANPLWLSVTAAIGVVMLATSVLKMCPLYAVFGFKTCRDC